MKILVTGGAGFIGSNVVDGYIKEGHEVVVVDNLVSGKKENVNPKAKFYQLDIRSSEIKDVIEKEKPDIINHHAAQISVPDSVRDPIYDADVNIKGFLNILEAAVACKVKKIIFISSGGAIYGDVDEYPTTEQCHPKPLSPYAITKYSSEYYLAYYKHQYGLEYTTLRYANIYGPRQIPHGEAGVVAIFMDNILKGKKSVLYHYPDDEEGMIRDYCFVEDVVDANIKALNKGSNDFFNIGTGVETKTLQLYRLILSTYQEMGFNVPDELKEPVRKPARPGDLKRSCLVVKKALKGLGWTPKTDLKTGILKTWQWRLAQEGV